MAEFLNPILNGDYADPSILRHGRDYYLTCSSAYKFEPALKILHSTDLVHWKTLCSALKKSSGIAAPELAYVNDTYYIYYPADGTNYVVTAKDPAGPWSEPIDLHIARIDPGHVVGPDGTRYLYLDDGWAVRLAPDGLSVEEDLGRLYEGWDYPAEYHTEGKFLESPKLCRRGDYYYLVCAEGGTAGPASAHMCIVARSKSPLGPWENMPSNPLIHTWSRKEKWWCKGHGTLFEAADGRWYIIYHAYEKGYLNHGRKTLMQPIEWTDDGWPYVPEAFPADQPQIYEPAESSETDDFCDDFANGAVRPYWSFFEEYDPGRLSAAQDGGLRVKCKGDSIENCSPMVIPNGYRSYTVEVDITLEGNAQGGLTLFYDEEHYCGIGLGSSGIQLYKYGRPYVRIPTTFRQMTLKLTNEEHEVSYAYRTKGSEWQLIDFCCEVSGINHNTLNGYLSLRPGLFACGNGTVCFKNFRYEPLLS